MRKKLYHGTLSRYKNSILKNGFDVSTRDDNYLGTGVYFYEDNQLAIKWARKKAEYKADFPVVFETEVCYDNVLDLTNDDTARTFELFVSTMDQEVAINNKRKLRTRQLMALKATLYVNTYCAKFGIDIVKGNVFCGERMFLYNSGIIHRIELQYCVRNLRAIVKNIVAYAEENKYDAI